MFGAPEGGSGYEPQMKQEAEEVGKFDMEQVLQSPKKLLDIGEYADVTVYPGGGDSVENLQVNTQELVMGRERKYWWARAKDEQNAGEALRLRFVDHNGNLLEYNLDPATNEHLVVLAQEEGLDVKPPDDKKARAKWLGAWQKALEGEVKKAGGGWAADSRKTRKQAEKIDAYYERQLAQREKA